MQQLCSLVAHDKTLCYPSLKERSECPGEGWVRSTGVRLLTVSSANRLVNLRTLPPPSASHAERPKEWESRHLDLLKRGNYYGCKTPTIGAV